MGRLSLWRTARGSCRDARHLRRRQGPGERAAAASPVPGPSPSGDTLQPIRVSPPESIS